MVNVSIKKDFKVLFHSSSVFEVKKGPKPTSRFAFHIGSGSRNCTAWHPTSQSHSLEPLTPDQDATAGWEANGRFKPFMGIHGKPSNQIYVDDCNLTNGIC